MFKVVQDNYIGADIFVKVFEILTKMINNSFFQWSFEYLFANIQYSTGLHLHNLCHQLFQSDLLIPEH